MRRTYGILAQAISARGVAGEDDPSRAVEIQYRTATVAFGKMPCPVQMKPASVMMVVELNFTQSLAVIGPMTVTGDCA